MRHPLALIGTVVAGFAMGVAEVMPGFSGGTVALVSGIYERLVAVIRQAVRVGSLTVRGRIDVALRSLAVMDWLFVTALGIGMVTALLTIASPLRDLIEDRPLEVSSVFLGLVLGAAAVAARRLRKPSGWHALLGLIAAGLAFVGLGTSVGTIADPSLFVIMVGGAIAVSAWILPGISGSFLLLVLGLYTPVLDALADRDLVVLGVFIIGCVIGLSGFSTALNWLLTRYHDLVLAVLIGFMAGSARVLWPWPQEGGIGNPELAPPVGDEAFLAAALAFGAFAAVWLLGLVASALDRGRQRLAARRGAAGGRGRVVPGTARGPGSADDVLLEGDVVDIDDAPRWDDSVAPGAPAAGPDVPRAADGRPDDPGPYGFYAR